MKIIEYDDINIWGPWIRAAMAEIVTPQFMQELRVAKIRHMEDARDFILSNLDRAAVTQHLTSRLAPFFVRLYHGTRLTDAETERVRADGLKSLVLFERRPALISVFQDHPRWTEVESSLDAIIHNLGAGDGAGKREDGCVHFCFSRAGLLTGCNHYLMYGAEVDDHVAHALFGDASGHTFLQMHRRAKLITFLAPFGDAAIAANPYGFPAGELPSLLGSLFGAWAYWETRPEFTIVSQRDCIAARFPGPIAAEQIERNLDIDDTELCS